MVHYKLAVDVSVTPLLDVHALECGLPIVCRAKPSQKDLGFISDALNAGANCVVTRDKQLQRICRALGWKIVTPRGRQNYQVATILAEFMS